MIDNAKIMKTEPRDGNRLGNSMFLKGRRPYKFYTYYLMDVGGSYTRQTIAIDAFNTHALPRFHVVSPPLWSPWAPLLVPSTFLSDDCCSLNALSNPF